MVMMSVAAAHIYSSLVTQHNPLWPPTSESYARSEPNIVL